MFPKATTLKPQAKPRQLLLALAPVFCSSWGTQGTVTAKAKCRALARDEGKVDDRGRNKFCSHWFSADSLQFALPC